MEMENCVKAGNLNAMDSLLGQFGEPTKMQPIHFSGMSCEL